MIWCVEDDQSIRDIIIYTLQQTGFAAKGFPDGEALFAALEEERPELLLLDIMLPGIDGVEILRRIRSGGAAAGIPVIMVTARGQEYDKVQSLDLGADDYLVKPFGMMEMVSRIKAVLRRSGTERPSALLKMGQLVLHTDDYTVYKEGKKLQLTYKEFALLRFFLENPGRAFTRDQLFASVWGEDYMGESRTVDVHIRTLRSKLGECGVWIETVRNVGYRMEAGDR